MLKLPVIHGATFEVLLDNFREALDVCLLDATPRSILSLTWLSQGFSPKE